MCSKHLISPYKTKKPLQSCFKDYIYFYIKNLAQYWTPKKKLNKLAYSNSSQRLKTLYCNEYQNVSRRHSNKILGVFLSFLGRGNGSSSFFGV